MSRILAIDPGNTESGWVLIDADTCKPLEFGKTANDDVLWGVVASCERSVPLDDPDRIFIEMVASYGMAVGADVFETCVWVGRYQQEALSRGHDVELVKRNPVKMHHCHNAAAKDSNIRQALVDRFALGERNYGKGTKDNPGWFYGFRDDIWQAYALAVYAADNLEAAA